MVFVITAGGHREQVEYRVGSLEHSHLRAAVFYIKLIKSHRGDGSRGLGAGRSTWGEVLRHQKRKSH